MRRPVLHLVVFLAAAGCQNSGANPTPMTRLHFPTGIAVDVPYTLGPDAGAAHTLYVAGDTNYDLIYDTGLFYALNLDAMMDAGPSGLIPPALYADAGWDGRPLQIPDLDAGDYWDRDFGVTLTDSMAGEVRMTATSYGTQRLFMASRYSNLVTAMEAGPGTVSCYGGGQDCNNDTAAPPLVVDLAGTVGNQIIDVFGVSNEVVVGEGLGPDGGALERDVFITHLRDEAYGSGGISVTGTYGNNQSQNGEAYIIRQNVDEPNCRLADPVGLYGTSSAVALTNGSQIYTLFTGRFGGVLNAIRELTVPVDPSCGGPDAGEETPIDPNTTPELGEINLSSFVVGTDGRGMALSTTGDRVFAIVRNPDSLLILRLGDCPTKNCDPPQDVYLPVGLSLTVAAVIPLPLGPAQVLPIPRVNQQGQRIGDLVAISCVDSDQVAFYDDEIGAQTASVLGVGNEPFGLVATTRSLPGGAILPGVRLFSTAFGSGQIAVIDVPDVLDATTAQVVAMIGSYEDTTVSPISPNSSLFTTATGGGPSGVP